MAIRVACDHCETTYTVDDRLEGKKIRCKECQHPIVVSARRTRRVARESEDGKPGFQMPQLPIKWILGGVAAVLVLIAGGLVAQRLIPYFTPAPVAQADHSPAPPVTPPPPPVKKQEPEWVARVARATAIVAVKTADATREGAGFFPAPGILVVGRQVLGAGDANSLPRYVSVTVFRGKPDEATLLGSVLGVDPASGVALVRVKAPNAPAPLLLPAGPGKVSPADKVAIFGPGSSGGKAIVPTDSSIAQLVKTEGGELKHLQLTAGAPAGGGPVVDKQGQLLGLAVGGPEGDVVIPREVLQQALEGSVDGVRAGPAYRDFADQLTAPLTLGLVDPLGKIKAVKVEVWAGPRGPVRPASRRAPEPVDGDGEIATVEAKVHRGLARCDAHLPPLADGKVYWARAVLNDSARWGPAFPFTVDARPLEPRALLLQYANPVPDRLIQVQAVDRSAAVGKAAQTLHGRLDSTVRGMMLPRGSRTFLEFYLVNLTADGSSNGQPMALSPPVQTAVRAFQFSRGFDAFGQVAERSESKNPTLAAEVRAEAERLVNQLYGSLDLAFVKLPNQKVKVGDHWDCEMPLSAVGAAGLSLKGTLQVTCTYLGARGNEAVIDLFGTTSDTSKGVSGGLQGVMRYDTSLGLAAETTLVLWAEGALDGGASSVGLAREAVVRQTPTPPGTPAPVVLPPLQGELVLDKITELNGEDPVGFRNGVPGFYGKTYDVRLERGFRYGVELRHAGGEYDPYLRVEGPPGTQVAIEDNDSGGVKNARVIFPCFVPGPYRIVATSAVPRQTGQFMLRVVKLLPTP